RNFVARTAAAAAALALKPAFAQEAYPARPVTFINPFPPGGAADVVARPFAAGLEPLLKQPVVIETKAGAAGAVGAQFAASAKPDGYTLLVHNDQQPYKNLKELVDDAKKRPNGIVFSSSGLYGALHLPTALFMKAAGIQMRHLPTNGGGPA